MSQEIQLQASINASKNGATLNGSQGATLDMSGNHWVNEVYTATTSATAVSLGNISGAPKAVLMYNLDQTNYIEVAGDSGITNFPQKLYPGTGGLPGNPILLAPESGTFYVKANTASCLYVLVAVEA